MSCGHQKAGEKIRKGLWRPYLHFGKRTAHHKCVNYTGNDGGINENESELIRSVIEFDDLEAIDIMTPRVDVEAVDKTGLPCRNRRPLYGNRFSRACRCMSDY